MGHTLGGTQGAPMGHWVGGMQGVPMIREASYGAQGGDAGSPYDQGSILWGTGGGCREPL